MAVPANRIRTAPNPGHCEPCPAHMPTKAAAGAIGGAVIGGTFGGGVGVMVGCAVGAVLPRAMKFLEHGRNRNGSR